MANHAYLNLWLREFTIESGLEQLEKLLSLFPASSTRLGFGLVIRSLDPGQTPSLEAELLAAPADVRAAASEYLHNDTAYEVTAHWDLWSRSAGSGEDVWAELPAPVEILLRGEEFDDAAFRETGHLELNLGFDHLYLSPPGEPEPSRYTRANARTLHTFLRSLEKELAPADRRLWSEGENDFLQRLDALLSS